MNRTKYLKGECGQCGGHLEFPAEATGLTTDCPHCGKPTELLLARPREEPAVSRRVIVWTASAVLILGLGLVGALVALNRAERYAARRQAQAAPKPSASVSTSTQPAAVPEPEDPLAKAGFKV